LNCKHCSPLNRIGQTGPGGGGRGEEVLGRQAGRPRVRVRGILQTCAMEGDASIAVPGKEVRQAWQVWVEVKRSHGRHRRSGEAYRAGEGRGWQVIHGMLGREGVRQVCKPGIGVRAESCTSGPGSGMGMRQSRHACA
jgi:hypothetical protein